MKNKLKKLLSIVAFGSLLNGFGQSSQWLFANTNASPAKAYINGGTIPMQTTGFSPAVNYGVTNNMITDAS